ncbi:CMRF35-like molecule 7 isoform X1 [Halichoerus grypus]
MRLWLVLLLLSLPGCFSIQGPESVRGLEGGSVSMQCHYTAEWETYEKWWCRGADWISCQILVQTNGSEQVMKRDRVSIRDNQSHHLFTVTMEDVRRDDTDTYWCGISRHGPDLGTSIKVTIDPALQPQRKFIKSREKLVGVRGSSSPYPPAPGRTPRWEGPLLPPGMWRSFFLMLDMS